MLKDKIVNYTELSDKKFSDIKIGERFYYNNELFEKISYVTKGGNAIHLRDRNTYGYFISFHEEDIVYPVNINTIVCI